MIFQGLKKMGLLIASRGDVALAVLLVTVIFMMVLPMPTVLVDTLIALNIAIAVVLLMVAVYLPSPLAFTAFPAVLLLSTLFRLALSITTTRLILLEADAGQIIYAFGDFVVAGNLVVGLIIFLIITLVQFIVITKGSERVAEVGARFTLDAMPGKQMSIDSDLRAGLITVKQASARRQDLEKESQLYGAMDGAMKFVKGDAIAGLIIIIINIVGGIIVGMSQHDMSAGEALDLYAILTVGDGMVAQIPAIFIAITAGIIVTRVTTAKSENLGEDIGNQIGAQPNALIIAAALLLGMALVPGFPTAVFIVLGLVLGAVGLTLRQRDASHRADLLIEQSLEGYTTHAELNDSANLEVENPETSSVILWLSENAREKIDPHSLHEELAQARRDLYQTLGVPCPGVAVRFDSIQDEDHYKICLNEIPIGQGQLVDKDKEQIPQALGSQLSNALRKNADQFIGVQETHQLLNQLEPQLAELIKEAQDAVPLHMIAQILRGLVAEEISIRDLRMILEGIVEWGQKEKDVALLIESVRGHLKRQISYRYRSSDNVLAAYIFDPKTEETIRNSIRQTPSGSFLSLEPAASSQLMEIIRRFLADCDMQKYRPVLLTSVEVRRHFRKFIEAEFYEVPVLAFPELVSDIKVQPLGQIELTG